MKAKNCNGGKEIFTVSDIYTDRFEGKKVVAFDVTVTCSACGETVPVSTMMMPHYDAVLLIDLHACMVEYYESL